MVLISTLCTSPPQPQLSCSVALWVLHVEAFNEVSPLTSQQPKGSPWGKKGCMRSSIRRKDRSKRSKMVCYSLLPKSLAGFALGVPGHLLCKQSLIKGQLTACSDYQYLTATALRADRQLQARTLGTAHLIRKEPSEEDFQSMLKTKYSVLEPAPANVHAQTDICTHVWCMCACMYANAYIYQCNSLFFEGLEVAQLYLFHSHKTVPWKIRPRSSHRAQNTAA